MAKKKAHRKEKMQHKVHQLSHAKKSHKDLDEEEFSKTLHTDVENGIEDQKFVKKAKMHHDPAADLGKRTKKVKKMHRYEDEDDDEIPHAKLQKKIRRQMERDDEIGTRESRRMLKKEQSDSDEEIPVRESKK